MRVLVTGGAGFVGSHLAERLWRDGNEVVILDDLSGGNLKNLEGITSSLFQEDIVNFEFQSIGEVDAIYHLACSKMVHSVEQPIKDLQVNALAMIRILEYAKDFNIPIVYTSSGSVYGNPRIFPTSEDYILIPESPYGVSKWMAEEYCKLYHKMYGLKTIIVRLHSVYGPRQSEIGVVTKFIRQGLEGKSFTIMGQGIQRRAFTYVDDTVNGIIIALKYGKSGEVYNIAGDKDYSIITLASTISNTLNIPMKTVFIPRRKGDLDKTNPSTEKIKILGFKAKILLPEGIKRTVNWFKNIK